MHPLLMLRSRSSGLLPVTHSCTFPRPDSRFGLGALRRKSGIHPAVLQRLLTYLLVTFILAGSIYGVMRVGRPRLATGPDDFAIAEGSAFFDGVAGGSVMLRQHPHRQQQQRHHVHSGSGGHDVHDRRAAMEEHHGRSRAAAAVGSAGADHQLEQWQQQHQHQVHHSSGAHLVGDVEDWDAIDTAETAEDAAALEQQALEKQHLAKLQHLDARQHQGQGEDLSHLHPDPVVAAHIAEQQALPRRMGSSLYAANLSAMDMRDQVLHTAALAGRVTLFVNVATHCGYTDVNYQGLTRLYERYKEYGLEVLAFPCNQFGHQEPGSHAEIEQFVSSRYGAKFTLMSKVEVNGPQQHPVFAWLKANTPPEPGHGKNEDIAWNFAKFLLDKHGNAVKRYGSDLVYHDIELDVYNELIKFN